MNTTNEGFVKKKNKKEKEKEKKGILKLLTLRYINVKNYYRIEPVSYTHLTLPTILLV